MTNSGIEGGVGLVVLQSSPMVPPFFTLLLSYFSFSHYYHFYMSMGRGNLCFKNVCTSFNRGEDRRIWMVRFLFKEYTVKVQIVNAVYSTFKILVVRLWVHVNIKASKTRSTALADFGSDNWFGSRVVCRVCKRLQVSYVCESTPSLSSSSFHFISQPFSSILG